MPESRRRVKRDHARSLVVPALPPADLEPVRGTRFRIKAQNPATVEFKGDDLGFLSGKQRVGGEAQKVTG